MYLIENDDSAIMPMKINDDYRCQSNDYIIQRRILIDGTSMIIAGYINVDDTTLKGTFRH
jgi:hypothetical protein